jgi:coenzyme F420-reducing hydrogenase beta subunit
MAAGGEATANLMPYTADVSLGRSHTWGKPRHEVGWSVVDLVVRKAQFLALFTGAVSTTQATQC